MKVSICIPAYEMHGEGRGMLCQLLNSIKNQTYKNYEVIVSDHTPDGLLEETCKESSIIVKYVKCTTDYGSSSANLNNAISFATGNLIKPMMQDDVFNQIDALAMMVRNIQTSNKNWCASDHVHYKQAAQTTYKLRSPVWQADSIINLALGHNTLGSPSVIMYKVDPTIKFDINLIWLMDCEFYSRYARVHGTPVLINHPLLSIREWEGSVTSTLATEDIRQQEIKYVAAKLDQILIYYV